jgi:hypothetical protein
MDSSGRIDSALDALRIDVGPISPRTTATPFESFYGRLKRGVRTNSKAARVKEAREKIISSLERFSRRAIRPQTSLRF